MTTITTNIKNGVATLIKDGAAKERIEGYLLFEGVPKKDALAYLKDLGLIGRQTFRQWLTNRCLEGFLSADEFTKELEAKGTNNEKKSIKVFDNERTAYNAIHAKYDDKIAELVKKESN